MLVGGGVIFALLAFCICTRVIRKKPEDDGYEAFDSQGNLQAGGAKGFMTERKLTVESTD